MQVKKHCLYKVKKGKENTIDTNYFDLSKYGFTLKEKGEINTWTASTSTDNGMIEVTDIKKCISIGWVFPDCSYPVAERYQCRDEKDLEFLLFNGRISPVSKPS